MLTFPCPFPIKIIIKQEPGAKEELLAIVRRHYPAISDSSFVFNQSENGNYLSITATVPAQDQPSLDALYRELTQNSYTKMVL